MKPIYTGTLEADNAMWLNRQVREVLMEQDWAASKVYDGRQNRVEEKIRSSKSLTLPVVDKGDKQISELINKCCQQHNLSYRLSNDHYDIVKYEAGEFFKPHRDHIKCQYSFAVNYVLIIYLSTPVGGETRIETDEGEVTVPAVENTYCLFQSHLVHEGMPVVSGVKRIFKVDLLIYDPDWAGPSKPLEKGFNFVSLDDYLEHLKRPEGLTFLTVGLGLNFTWQPDTCGHYTQDYLEAAEKFSDHLSDYQHKMYKQTYREESTTNSCESDSSFEEPKRADCVMCGISLALREYHDQIDKEDYYGLKLLKLCLGKHFNRLVKYVSIQGRSVSSFRLKRRLDQVDPDFTKDLCYSAVSSGAYSDEGGNRLTEDYSSLPCIRTVRPVKELCQSQWRSHLFPLPDNYLDILRQFKTAVKERVLSDKTNEAVRLSHMQESHCNEAYYTEFEIGYVYHVIYAC